MPDENISGDTRPISDDSRSCAEGLTVREDQRETDGTLERRLEHGEQRCAPGPLPEGKATQVNGCHEQHERCAEQKKRAHAKTAEGRRIREHDCAVESDDDTRNESHLDDGSCKL